MKASLTISPSETASYLDLKVELSGISLTLIKDPATCPTQGSSTHCQSTTMLDNRVQQIAVVNGSLYIGGLPEVTPYVRSKIATLSGFRGCLGVSFITKKMHLCNIKDLEGLSMLFV